MQIHLINGMYLVHIKWKDGLLVLCYGFRKWNLSLTKFHLHPSSFIVEGREKSMLRGGFLFRELTINLRFKAFILFLDFQKCWEDISISCWVGLSWLDNIHSSVEEGVEEVEGGLRSMVPTNETSLNSPRSIISGGFLLDDIDNPIFNFFCKIVHITWFYS